jgi:hypothetical protein
MLIQTRDYVRSPRPHAPQAGEHRHHVVYWQDMLLHGIAHADIRQEDTIRALLRHRHSRLCAADEQGRPVAARLLHQRRYRIPRGQGAALALSRGHLQVRGIFLPPPRRARRRVEDAPRGPGRGEVAGLMGSKAGSSSPTRQRRPLLGATLQLEWLQLCYDVFIGGTIRGVKHEVRSTPAEDVHGRNGVYRVDGVGYR